MSHVQTMSCKSCKSSSSACGRCLQLWDVNLELYLLALGCVRCESCPADCLHRCHALHSLRFALHALPPLHLPLHARHQKKHRHGRQRRVFQAGLNISPELIPNAAMTEVNAYL